MAPPKRIAEVLFRRDMLGPSFSNLAGSVVALLLLEKIFLDYMFPPLVPTVELMEAKLGKIGFSLASGALVSSLGFWGVGGLMALPAILQVKRWKIQVNRSLDTQALWKPLLLVSLNFWTSVVLGSLLFAALLPESSSDWRRLPSTWTLTRDIVVWLIVEEVLFFYIHKQLHDSKRLYAAIHKLHHTWTAPVSLVAIYCHPLEHIVCNMMPVIVGPVLCGSHLASISIFLFGGFVHTCGVHSGYWCCDDNGIHDEHHRKFTVNYGVSGFMDEWYGTFQLPAGAAGAGPAVSTPAAASPEKKGE